MHHPHYTSIKICFLTLNGINAFDMIIKLWMTPENQTLVKMITNPAYRN